MILDSLKNAARYEGLNPRFKQAFEFIKSTDLTGLEPGKVLLDGENLFANVQVIDGKTSDEAKVETHRKYIDIQVPISGKEIMGWLAADSLKQVFAEYNSEKEMALYTDPATAFIEVQPGEFVVFFPEDAHQPGIAEGKLKKMIVKVRLD